MDLSMSDRKVGDWTVLEVGGEIDAYSSPAFADRLGELLTAESSRLVVDLDGVGFLDSTGLGVLIGGHNRAGGFGGELRVGCGVERVLKLLRITGLNDVLAVYASAAEALAAPPPCESP